MFVRSYTNISTGTILILRKNLLNLNLRETGFKRNKLCIFQYVVMFMMTSKILNLVDSWKTQISKYLSTKNFFPLVKKIVNCTLRAILWQKNSFLVEVNFKSKANFELTFFPYLTNRKSLRNCQKRLFHAHKSFSSYFFLCQPLPENLILDKC